jgi:hypothetical protein
MNKKTTSTVDQLINAMNPKEKNGFDQKLRSFALSELILALMEQDDISVRKLAKLANVSPTVVQAMRSGIEKDFSMQSFFKILKGLGCKKIIVEFNGQYLPLSMSVHKK